MTARIGKHINTEDVVISGISGVFPQSENMQEFAENLLAGKDLIQETDRWGKGKFFFFSIFLQNLKIGNAIFYFSEFADIPPRAGILTTLDRFDHSFFRVRRLLVEKMNVASRILLEKVFEAIVDAGSIIKNFSKHLSFIYSPTFAKIQIIFSKTFNRNYHSTVELIIKLRFIPFDYRTNFFYRDNVESPLLIYRGHSMSIRPKSSKYAWLQIFFYIWRENRR